MASIAIIGSGISGMAAAALLHPKYEITLYEKSPVIGGHTRTRVVEVNGKQIPVDTGFIVFNYRNYPHLSAMFAHYNVPVQKSDMTLGVTINNGEIEWGAKDLNAVFGQRRNFLRPQFWRLLWDVMRFNRLAVKTAERLPQLTLGGLLKELRMGPWFAPYYILPMGGAIWSCPLEVMLQFPALNFTRFFEAHGLLSVRGQPQWYTVSGGSKEYVKRLTAPFASRIETSTGITKVTRLNGKSQVTDVNGKTQEYDHVIFACHADQALAMLADVTPEECAVLGSFRYQDNRAILHKDAGIMPRRKACWASWVYHSDGYVTDDPISVTYWMNLLQSIDNKTPLFVTLNPQTPIAPEHIFDEHLFEHPVYSLEAAAAQERMPELQGKQNSWFCGAYLRNGFHEDGIASAVEVARKLGAEVPWKT